jgi:hypothetical protein
VLFVIDLQTRRAQAAIAGAASSRSPLRRYRRKSAGRSR